MLRASPKSRIRALGARAEMLTWGEVRNPYDVLELPSSATPDEVRAAFRRLAAQHHPDRHRNSAAAQERFTEINTAYQILSDPQKRAAYDRFGSAAFRPGGNPGFDAAGIESVVADLFKAVGLGRSDGTISQTLHLSFEEAAEGCKKELSYERIDHCPACRGSGAAPHSRSSTCSACEGRGRVRFQQGLLSLLSERTCSKCRGTGRIPEQACSGCQGRGLSRGMYSVVVQVPAGAADGSTQSVPRAGHRLVPAGKHGRLELTLRVSAHPFFSRSGDDILCRVPISFVTAALGGQVEIPTLSGKIKLTVPPATQPGTILRVRGKGLSHRLRAGRGDQLVEMVVEVPARLSARAEELLHALGKELGQDAEPQQRSFMDKLKEIFG